MVFATLGAAVVTLCGAQAAYAESATKNVVMELVEANTTEVCADTKCVLACSLWVKAHNLSATELAWVSALYKRLDSSGEPFEIYPISIAPNEVESASDISILGACDELDLANPVIDCRSSSDTYCSSAVWYVNSAD